MVVATMVVANQARSPGGGGFGKRDELDERIYDSGRKREPDDYDRGKRKQDDNDDKWPINDHDRGKREVPPYKKGKREQDDDDKGKREKISGKREETADGG